MRNKKLRVILLAPTRVIGGITTWTKTLMKYSDSNKIEYKVIDTSKLYDPLGKKTNIIGIFFGMRDSITRLIKLIKTKNSFRPHLVYFTCAPSMGLLRDSIYMYMLKALKMPCIAHLRGGNVRGFFGGNIIKKTIVNNALKTCRLIIVITRETEQKGKQIFGEKILFMPNMIDDDLVKKQKTKQIKSNKEQLKIIHVAWQSSEKGSFDLVEAIKHVKSNIDCDLIGDVDRKNKEQIENKIKKLNIKDKIRLTGIKIGKNIEHSFQNSDIFVLPSHSEGFPNVILEAMAYGIPIIANEVGNVREMIGVDTYQPAGLLLRKVDPIDPNELAEKIDLLINNVEMRKKMSKNGRKLIKRYLASKIVPELEEKLYNQFIN